MDKKLVFILFFVLFIGSILPINAQCAMCRAVLESDPDGTAAKSINNGIMYLMVFPYLLVGGVGIAVYRTLKNRKKQA